MTGVFRVLVTGSQGWKADTRTPDGFTLAQVLDGFAHSARQVGFAGVTVVHGAGSRGADAVADRWAVDRAAAGWRVTVERHPADWRRYGRRAGRVRNQRMVDAGADVCVAFIVDGSRDASHCADVAELAGVDVQRHWVSSGRVMPDFDETDRDITARFRVGVSA